MRTVFATLTFALAALTALPAAAQILVPDFPGGPLGPGSPLGPITSGYGLEAGASTRFGSSSSQRSSDFDGGEFATSASASDTTYGVSRASANYASGATFLPELKAYAQANAGTSRRASATAVGIQGYRYDGAAPKTIVINYLLDAVLTPNAASTNTTASVRGDVAAWLGTNTDYFTDPGTLFFEILSGNPTLVRDDPFLNAAGINLAPGSIALDVNPGDNFYVYARINASASDLGIADAESTFTATFADPANLTAVAVPEPASLALLTLGALALAGHRRRA